VEGISMRCSSHATRRFAPALSALVLVSLTTLAAVGTAHAGGAKPPGYHLTQKIQVGGQGGWDYITCDPAGHRLFASHGSSVVVLRTDSMKVVGEIPKTEGVHGATIATDLGRGYVSNGRTNDITVFDLASLAPLRTIPAGTNPDAILYDAFTHRVFAFNGRSNDVTVVDALRDTVVATLPAGGKPEFAVTDGAGRIYFNVEDKSEIVALDAKALTVAARWPIAPGEEPSGLAIDVKHRRLFSVCGNKLMVVVDADHGTVLASLPIGDRTDGCAFDPGTGLAFASNGEGSVTVVREDSPGHFSVAETAASAPGARTIALDPETHALYLPTASFGPAPAPTPEHPRPRPTILPDSFVILKLER
jgi:YVTN family beta-propeller protein